MHLRQSCGFMRKSFSWTELVDDAYLGNVAESKALAAGFGGRVRAGRLGEHAIVTKERFRDRDEDDEELSKEVYFGFLVPSFPVIGYGINETADICTFA